MAGRGREIAEVCKERSIDILCVQETKWSGKSARVLLEGHKIYYTYAPQTGEADEEKEMFMENFERIIKDIPGSEKVLVGADFTGHVGKRSDGYQRVRGGKGHGQRNTEGERILECAESLDMAVVNTFYQKRDEHLITFKSGQHATQIDYVMIRSADLKSVRNCKVIPEEAVVTQHRLLCVVLKIKQEKKRKPKTQKRIKIWKLKGDKIIEFQK
ncbi:craniofacial development protein 2-like [Penaeus chinensis]|uniref:craniofacial development protein 2-like n=1 Tax=Penaeus chinensis TaxID=139456 RepID=UPI001FB7CC7D|nr:craniofacial development protein 2-like [Penaeus chinensis]